MRKEEATTRTVRKRKRRPKIGTLKQLTQVLWSSIDTLEDHLHNLKDSDNVETAELCKVCHALSQTSSTYVKALEVGELEARLVALEQANRVTAQ